MSIKTELNKPHIKNGKWYYSAVDFDFLESMGLEIIMYQPWQIGIVHEEIEGKFMWYPKAGTLMYDNFKEEGIVKKLCRGPKFIAGGFPSNIDPNATENVYEEIMKKVDNYNELGSNLPEVV